jgi:hypothetical protein
MIEVTSNFGFEKPFVFEATAISDAVALPEYYFFLTYF